jgi:hypothetical protein
LRSAKVTRPASLQTRFGENIGVVEEDVVGSAAFVQPFQLRVVERVWKPLLSGGGYKKTKIYKATKPAPYGGKS